MFPRCFVLAAALATSATATATAAEWKHYVGTINGNVPITADLRFEGNDKDLSGVYMYNRVGTNIRLETQDRTDLGVWKLKEYGSTSSDATGYWTLTFDDEGRANGTWASPDGTTQLPIALQENYSGAARIGEITSASAGKNWSFDSHVLFPSEPKAAAQGYIAAENPQQRFEYGLEYWTNHTGEPHCHGESGYEDVGSDCWGSSGAHIIYNREGVSSFGMSAAEYECGAIRPYQNAWFLTLDLTTGRKLQWYDFVRPDAEALLNQRLREAGVETDVRELGDIGVDGEGLWFSYAPFHGNGGHPVQIPWKKLAGYTTGHPITR
jgi:hypothetical protein